MDENKRWWINAIFKYNYYIELTTYTHTHTPTQSKERKQIIQLKAVYYLEENKTEKYEQPKRRFVFRRQFCWCYGKEKPPNFL